jgi:surface polysaccharide O-acyltransferase-like enzyme
MTATSAYRHLESSDRTNAPAFLSYGDGMRVVAVIGVIAVHASGAGVMRYGQLPPLQWWNANVIDSLCRWAVPMFIMLSGALILDPNRDERGFAFYRKRLGRIGIPLLAWAAFYFLWTSAFYGEPVDRAFVLHALFDGLTYNHLYFLFLILGLYAVAPLLRVYVKRVRRAIQWTIALLVLVLVSCGIPQNAIPMNVFTRFVPFIGYFLAGHLLRDSPLAWPVLTAAILAFPVTTAIIAIGTGRRFSIWGPDDWRSLSLYDTLGPTIILQSIAAFVLLRICFTERAATRPWPLRVTRLLAPLVFGIYLVHRAVHDLLATFATSRLPQAPLLPTTVFQVTLTFVISAAVVAVIKRVPYLRHVV